MTDPASETIYTAISFAPVQGFIEKSRKLRDLYGASLILSYLSSKLLEAGKKANCEVISPGAPNLKKGMPNRILLKGYLDRNIAQNTLRQEWQTVLSTCRQWVEKQVPVSSGYHWSQTEEQVDKQSGAWERWGNFAWELFWGVGSTPQASMDDLENRKLKRDWVGINWTGESSSLSGTDAIACPRLGEYNSKPGRSLNAAQQAELEAFYTQLAAALEKGSADPEQPEGKFLSPNERLSIPELVKRLVTRYDGIGNKLDSSFKVKRFSEITRKPTENNPAHWTGWFMGDGDKVGDHLKKLAKSGDAALKSFSEAMRHWGQKFEQDFPEDLGRVIYAGGDDFLGILYSSDAQKPLDPQQAMNWLFTVNDTWKEHGQGINLSLGFVWAGHSVPQRDVLQHCREAEQRSKSLGRDRVTIRVVFNSGQYVQWTCPWNYVDILEKYRDRNHQDKTGTPEAQNWTHIHNDWATLKARHAIRLNDRSDQVDDRIALEIFKLYFNDMERFEEHTQEIFKKEYTPKTVIEWLDGLVNVGWQLCSNS
jgi:CRISPR-associated protein Cmr2